MSYKSCDETLPFGLPQAQKSIDLNKVRSQEGEPSKRLSEARLRIAWRLQSQEDTWRLPQFARRDPVVQRIASLSGVPKIIYHGEQHVLPLPHLAPSRSTSLDSSTSAPTTPEFRGMERQHMKEERAKLRRDRVSLQHSHIRPFQPIIQSPTKNQTPPPPPLSPSTSNKQYHRDLPSALCPSFKSTSPDDARRDSTKPEQRHDSKAKRRVFGIKKSCSVKSKVARQVTSRRKMQARSKRLQAALSSDDRDQGPYTK